MADSGGMSLPMSVVVKREPTEYPSAFDVSSTSELPTDNKKKWTDTEDADVYMREYVTVEAFIDPKNTHKLIIPVDIPYMERRHRAAHPPKMLSDNVGKIKMRKLSELTRPETLKITPRRILSRSSAHRQAAAAAAAAGAPSPSTPYHRHRDNHRSMLRPMEPCSCPQCLRPIYWWNSYSHCLASIDPPPTDEVPLRPPSSFPSTLGVQNNFWRPFI